MKPPAFQFYAKDWRSSPTVRSMTLEEEGLYIRMCALAWDSEEPGVITLSERELCRQLRIYSGSLRRFLAKFSSSWHRVGANLVQSKLHLQFLKYKEISEKRSQAASKSSANAQQKGMSAFAVASASASAQSKDNPALSHTQFYRRNPKEEERLREVAYGSGPSDVTPLGGFKVLSCEACGEKFTSRQRHARECKGKKATA